MVEVDVVAIPHTHTHVKQPFMPCARVLHAIVF